MVLSPRHPRRRAAWQVSYEECVFAVVVSRLLPRHLVPPVLAALFCAVVFEDDFF